MPDFKNIIFKEDNNITWIQFNRPQKLNAFTKNMWEELFESIELAKNNKTMLVVFSGSGKSFSAGDDIPSMYELKNNKDSSDFFKTLQKPLQSLLELEKPTIGAVDGVAYGGGFEILLFMDIVIATKDSKFALPEVKLGLIPPVALTIGFEFLGIKQIKRIALTGEAIDAIEAQRIGFVDYITTRESLRDKTLDVAWKILANAPQSVRFIKKYSNKYMEMLNLNKIISQLAELSLDEAAKKRMEDFIFKRKDRKEENIFC